MKILRFDDERVGVLSGEIVVDISDLVTHRAERRPHGVMEELIGSFDVYRPGIAALVERGRGPVLADVTLLSPLPRPSRVLAAFVNYVYGPDKGADALPMEFFHKSPYLVGPGGTVELPDIDGVVAHQAEAELAFVIGKPASKVREADAFGHVFGYAPFLDVAARGLTRKSQFLPKGQETFAGCGPWITTADEIADPHDLRVRSWVSGAASQDYSTRLLAHKIPAQIAWLSRFVTLHPGDVVATGASTAGLMPFNAGDTLEIEIAGLGRAGFQVGGDSPRKLADFKPGGSAGLGITNVR